ncbi:MAG: molybdenum cofactor guanylyltransferase [Candidatus Dormibacteraeota bacterium]|nr:molybdenum cofactor guanylyltransferase [Candidatus Dormibacteraeota bacterium]
MPGPPLTVAVLCGGASRRMGTDKRDMTLEGQSLLDRAIARITPIAATVILASGHEPVARPWTLTVTDERDARGPLAGIVASLERSPHPLCAVVAADMPDIDPDLLRTLASKCTGADAALPLSEHGIEPLHAVYARSALRTLRAAAASPDQSVRSALLRLRVRYVDASALGASPRFARNLNTPEDVRGWLSDRGADPPPR